MTHDHALAPNSTKSNRTTAFCREPLRQTYSVATLRAIDTAAIAAIGDTGYTLMCRAGDVAWQLAKDTMMQLDDDCRTEGSIAVVAGAGNNGGDAWVVARLAQRDGYHPVVYYIADKQSTETAQQARDEALAAGVTSQAFNDSIDDNAKIIIDGLLGIGLKPEKRPNKRPDKMPDKSSVASTRLLEHSHSEHSYSEHSHSEHSHSEHSHSETPPSEPSQTLADIISAINAHPAWVLALDIPSGVFADTGGTLHVSTQDQQTQPLAVKADATMSFIGDSPGLFTHDGPDYVGRLHSHNLGIENAQITQYDAAAACIHFSQLKPLPKRQGNSHKGRFGCAALIGGDAGMAGAIMLSSRALGRTGVGLMHVATRAAHVPLILQVRPECMVHSLEFTAATDASAALASCFSQTNHTLTALAIGPGLGQTHWGRDIMQAVLSEPAYRDIAKVLDADALNLLCDSTIAATLNTYRNLDTPLVLTPHPGEAARLLGTDIDRVQADRLTAAQQLANRYHAVVVLKGQGALVCAPSDWNETPLISLNGNPGMSSGGMGDVLTGIIAGFLAQGLCTWQATVRGVCLHGAAGDKATAQLGESSVLASDLIDRLPEVMQSLSTSDAISHTAEIKS